jgi:predicted Zn-ribbon and HTH transcriptional regulator
MGIEQFRFIMPLKDGERVIYRKGRSYCPQCGWSDHWLETKRGSHCPKCSLMVGMKA